jgi:hypothetical protein
MTKERYGKLIAGLIGAWFTFSLVASALHMFSTDPNRPPLPLGLAVLIPLAVFALWFAGSENFRRFVYSLNPRTLTLLQSWRIAGYAFLVLYAYGILPGIFALPAGWGDIFIGATAPLIALGFTGANHRKGYILWQVLGITDLVTAVTLGTTARLVSPQAAATGAMTVLPLSLIPTFGVPLFLIFHIICITQARRWSENPRFGEQLSA